MKNVSIEDVEISAKESVGSLVGSMNGTIENVHVSGVTINSTHWAGGIVGYHYGDMSNCSATDTVITLTFDTEISDNGDKAGGLIGYHGEGSYAINNCTAERVSITGVRDVGGLVGAAQTGNVFTNCHVTGSTVTASKVTFEHSNPYAGGIIGRAAGATVTLQYSSAVDVTVTSYLDEFSGNLVGGPAANWVNLPVMLVSGETKSYYDTIQAAVNAAIAGDIINVAAGEYVENVIVNKAITLQGAGSEYTTIVATDGNATPLTFNSNGATVSGFHLTHNYTQAELDAWNFNNNGVIFYQNTSGNTLSNCKVTKNRNGIYINNARNNIIQENIIENNRTGLNLTNYVDGTIIQDNVIQNNWTLGLVYYQNSAELPTDFDNVTVEGNSFNNNWYSEILIKNAITSPTDTGTLDVTDNTFSDNPVTYTTSADPKWNEPGHADLKPVEFGGTATMPTTPLPTLRIYGVPDVTLQYDHKTLMVGANQPYTTIQSAIADASDGDTILVAAGTYDEENILITKGITLQGAGADKTFIAPNAVTNNSTIIVRNPSGNVTINGFNFVMQPKPNYGSAVLVTGDSIGIDSATVTISNNVVTGSDDGSKCDYGFYGQGNNAKIVITGNTINKTGDNPIVMEQQFGSTTVENNTFYITASPDYDAYYSMVYSGKTISTPQIVQNNVFHLDHSGSGYSQAITFTTAVLNAWGGQPGDTGHYADIQIKNNTIYTGGPSARGIGLIDRSSVSGNGTITGAVVTGNKIIGEAATDAETYGITLRGDIRGAVIQNNEISNVNLGFRVQKNLDSGATLICSSGTDFSLNKVTSVTIAAQNTDCPEVDASPNWWGSYVGPNPNTILGNVTYEPWCGTEACTTFNPVFLPKEGTTVETIEGAIEDATPGTIIVIPDGIFQQDGPFILNKPGITIRLSDSTVIQNSSPCFVVNASFTKIYAEPGAKCIPVGGANGIDVAAGLTDIRVKGLEIDGTGQSTGDGIHFDGAINGVVLADNKIHGLDGDGVEFEESPTGTVDIHGNLFASNGGVGINNSDATDAKTVAAEYNSWGSYNGPTGEGGDGVSANVDADPYTYGDFWMSSSGSPWADQVVKGQTITYTIKALVKEVIAADVTFTYPEGLTVTASQAIDTKFESATLTHNAGTRTFTYIGMSTNGNENGTVDLFSVTFTANANMRDAVMNIVDGSFGMAGVGSSSNVYVQSINDGSITVIDLPTIDSADIQGYYLSGEERQFSVVLTNPPAGGNFEHVYVDFRIANANTSQIEKIEYSVDNGANWVALGVGPGTSYGNVGSDIVGYFGKIAGGGFPLAPNTTPTTLFRVTFKTREQGDTDFPNSYSISMSLKDADTADPDTELAAFTKTAYVYDKPTLSSTDIQGYYLSGEQREFSVVLTNPSTGGNFAHVYVNYMIADADMDEIQSIEYSVDHTNWVVLGAAGSGTSYEEDVDGNIVGYFGQITGGGFPMARNSTQTTWFRVTFKTREQGTTDYPTSYDISMQLMDADFTPDRPLTDFEATANVYDKPSLTSTDIMGPYLAGVPQDFHVTVNNPATGGNFVDSIYYVFTIEDAEPADIASLSCNGIPVTLTDSGTDLIGRVGWDDAGFPMPPNQTWQNTCNVKFKNAGSYDFTVDMVDNPSGVLANDRILVSMSQTATVNSGFAITGTFTMQGNLNRGGIPVTLTWTGTGWAYEASDTTEDLLENNFQVTVTYGGGYLITTNQPRYLNLTAASAKSINVDGAKTLNALMLRGGNVKNEGDSLDKVDLGDAGMIGAVYGNSGDPLAIPADANFDGKVNILDLALVGGNYLLTTATAYTSWAPLP